MNKLPALCAVGIICCMSGTKLGATGDTPVWTHVADTILTSLDGLAEALANDSLLYDNWKSSLEQLYTEFDECDILRQQIFESIRSGVTDAHELLENTRASSQAAAAAARVREQNLLDQLSALQSETQAEIDYLNRLLENVSYELAETKKAYDDLVQATETKADELIQSLNTARDNYEIMVEKRANFLELLNTLIDRTRANLQTTIVEAEDINQRVRDLVDTTIES